MGSPMSELRDGMHVDRDVPIRMNDGLVLKADVFRPEKEEHYPSCAAAVRSCMMIHAIVRRWFSAAGRRCMPDRTAKLTYLCRWFRRNADRPIEGGLK